MTSRTKTAILRSRSGTIALAAAVLVLTGSAHAGSPQRQFPTFRAHVIGVMDGDTIKVLDAAKVEHRIRFWGIDAPEKRQPFGTLAKKEMSDLVFDRDVMIEVKDVDRYGREVAVVTMPPRSTTSLSVNELMVRAGLAWWYEHYAPNAKELESAQKSARTARVGLWSEPGVVAPWEWRKNKK